ncbi:MAG: formate/nitrite transporter family protein [Labrys sp. (in: a-proteobacteria)]
MTDLHERHPDLDALLPVEIARKAEAIGVAKARLETGRLLALAILAGAFIGLGAMFATTVLAGTNGALPFGPARLIVGVAFSLGLILVIVGGAELFTGNALMVMALGAGRISISELLRAWALVFIGNFGGAVATALMVFLAGQPRAGGGAVATAAVALAEVKVALPFMQAFFMGVLCNVLVCLAVWLSLGARSTSDKILAIIFPVSAFVAAGFEHSVANMYIVPMGLLIINFAPDMLSSPALSASGALTTAVFLWTLIPVTLGNVFGGGVLVGGVYWFIYLRPSGDVENS